MFLGFLFGLLTLMGTAALLARSVFEFGAERTAVTGARSDIDNLTAFLATVEDAETGQRGYLLTGDTAYLAPYRAAALSLDDRLNAVERSGGAEALRPHVVAKMAELAESIRLRRESESAAMAMVRSGVGLKEMSAIRAIVRSITASDERRLTERIRAYDASVRALIWHLALAIALQFVLAGLLFLLTRRLSRERELAAASEERFRRLSDASTDGVIVVRDGVIVETNVAWCRMFGGDHTAMLGMFIASLIAPDDRDAVVRAMRENLTDAFDLTCLRLDGTTFDGQMASRPIVYRDAPGRIVVLRDITEWSRVTRLKNEFVSTVSHELRTPLTSINGALRLIDSGAMGALPPAMGNLATIARTNCERLIRLVNDMLDLDKIEAGKLQLRYAALTAADLVQTTLDGVRAMANDYHVRLDTDIDVPRPFSGDRDRIIQVLTNLVSNAVKFATTESTVTVTSQMDTVGGTVRFAVTNAGPGIAAADMGRLFSRFQQIDGSDARRRGGTGLGLTIAKAIVEQHGGTIGAESTPNVTTTFWFELPCGDRHDAGEVTGVRPVRSDGELRDSAIEVERVGAVEHVAKQ
jgi:PAS domain S-box-containing protein